jgi:S-DNA-T family DNA segregation ATPase FtsK/SpoIIIE
MRKKLEYQADRIEAVLTMHKIPARVTGGTVTPRWVRFQVLPAVGTRISKIKGLKEEVAAALDAPGCRISRRGAAVAVEVPRDDPQSVRLLPLYRQLDEHVDRDDDAGLSLGAGGGIPAATAVLGLAEDGAPLLIRLPSPDVAHILVAGTTGSGKTALLQTMILSLAMANAAPSIYSPLQGGAGGVAMVLVDPKGHAFGVFGGLPHLARPVIRDVGETVEALQSLVRLMEKRGSDGSALMDEGGRPCPLASAGPAVAVVIDELVDLLMVGGKDVRLPLTRLTQRGREAGIHIIAATQKPTAAVLGPLIKANFPVRLVGRVTSVEDARTATGWSGTGAERLLGRGDFLAVAEGRVTRFQVAHVSPAEIREVVGHLARGGAMPASPPLAGSRRISLPQRARQLAGALRGGV